VLGIVETASGFAAFRKGRFRKKQKRHESEALAGLHPVITGWNG
jgi:hypothetical protein